MRHLAAADFSKSLARTTSGQLAAVPLLEPSPRRGSPSPPRRGHPPRHPVAASSRPPAATPNRRLVAARRRGSPSPPRRGPRRGSPSPPRRGPENGREKEPIAREGFLYISFCEP